MATNVGLRDINDQNFADRSMIANLIGRLPGSIYFVSSVTGSANNDGLTRSKPLATLATAVAKCAANSDDVVYLLPGHAEAGGSSAITIDKAGITIIGGGIGSTRATFTASTSAVDMFNVTAANVEFRNTVFAGAASGCTALVNLTAASARFIGCRFEHGAAPLSAITVASAAHKFHIEKCQFVGTAAGPDYGVNIEFAAQNWRVIDCLFDYSVSVGLDNAGIGCSNTTLGGLVQNCIFIGMDLTMVDINSSTSATAGDGIVLDCAGTGYSAVANIDTAVDAGGFGVVRTYFTDLAAERGAWIPVTSPA